MNSKLLIIILMALYMYKGGKILGTRCTVHLPYVLRRKITEHFPHALTNQR